MSLKHSDVVIKVRVESNVSRKLNSKTVIKPASEYRYHVLLTYDLTRRTGYKQRRIRTCCTILCREAKFCDRGVAEFPDHRILMDPIEGTCRPIPTVNTAT
jgi:hypothetical protein